MNASTPVIPPQVTTNCSLWLAPSTIPGAGLGLFFAGNSALKENSIVVPGDLGIPLVDMNQHTMKRNRFLWDDYTWAASTSFATMEHESESKTSAVSLGVGAVANCLFPRINFQDRGSESTLYDTVSMHRALDVGVGAFTPYHGRQGIATRSIEPGEELFEDYGEPYFAGERRNRIGMVPFMAHFEQADKVLHAFASIFKESDKESVEVYQNLWQLVTSSLTSLWDSRTLRALPPSEIVFAAKKPGEDAVGLDLLLQQGVSHQYDHRSVRNVAWLEANGGCMDHVRVRQPSHIPQAGRGAFTIRDIPAGHVIAPTPLIHVPQRGVLDMKYPTQNVKTGPRAQLLLNYCFGHKESTLLLCPYGVALSAVNHFRHFGLSTSPTSNEVGPNARLAWNHQLSSKLEEWKELPLVEWAFNYTAGLVVDLIATRNIQNGEEVTIDYGNAWERAWTDHIASWQPLDELYVSAAELNQEAYNCPLPTYQELLASVKGKLLRSEFGVPMFHGRLEYFNLRSTKILLSDDYRVMRGLPPSKALWHRIRIVDRYLNERGEKRYNAVRVGQLSIGTQCFIRVLEIIWDLPRAAFIFRDKPYTRDHAHESSFRHEMMFPDDLFPKAWKNES